MTHTFFFTPRDVSIMYIKISRKLWNYLDLITVHKTGIITDISLTFVQSQNASKMRNITFEDQLRQGLRQGLRQALQNTNTGDQ